MFQPASPNRGRSLCKKGPRPTVKLHLKTNGQRGTSVYLFLRSFLSGASILYGWTKPSKRDAS